MTASVKPEFYLSSSESTHFHDVRACYLQGLVTDDIRDDYLLVRIEPAVRDPETGEYVEHVLLCGRYEHFKVVTKEECVYILKILSPTVLSTYRCDKTQVKLIALGEVHLDSTPNGLR